MKRNIFLHSFCMLIISAFLFSASCALFSPTPAAAVPVAGFDTDGDLVPDWFEDLYAGLDKNNSDDGNADLDGDTLTNRDEFYAGTNPTVFNSLSVLSEQQIINLFEGKAFLYFWEQSRLPLYLTADYAHFDYDPDASDDRHTYSDNFNSIASTGFSLVSYVVADEKGWIDHEAAYARIETLLTGLRAMQDSGDTYNKAKNGFIYHWLNNNGTRHNYCEISTIDHALLVAGALVAGEYYKGTAIERLARELYEHTKWKWLFDESDGTMYQSWNPEPPADPSSPNYYDGGSVNLDHWNRYSELLIMQFLAMGNDNPAYGIPSSSWDALTRGTGNLFPWQTITINDASWDSRQFAFVPNMPQVFYTPDGLPIPDRQNTAIKLTYLHAGSLHNHQYSHLFADLRVRRDRYGVDFFANSIAMTMVNRQFCIGMKAKDSTQYANYNENSWGLMAGDSSIGYIVMQPPLDGPLTDEDYYWNTDGGTVLPNAPLGSLVFTPRQSLDFTKDILTRKEANEDWYKDMIGRYGFPNAYNRFEARSGSAHWAAHTVSLDLGPVVALENYQTGLIWKYLMRNSAVQNGMRDAGFDVGPVEPFLLHFDNSTDHMGSDPNEFGGYEGAWGSASIEYQYLTVDPFPDKNYGPQGWYQKIEATNTDSGAYITLNNHSVSNWDRLSFWIRAEESDEPVSFTVGLKDSATDYLGYPVEQTEVKLPIEAYHPDGHITSTWTEVRIPLRAFTNAGLRLTRLDNISFTCMSSDGGTISVDDFAFLGDEFKPAAPTSLTGTVNADDTVTLNWDKNEEVDVVGYRIYGKSILDAEFSLWNDELIVPNTAIVPLSASGTTEYYVTAVDNAAPQNESEASTTFNAVKYYNPVLGTIPNDIALLAGTESHFFITATDNNPLDTLTFTGRLADGSPLDTVGADLTTYPDRTAEFSWTPTPDQGSIGGAAYNFIFTVEDQTGRSDESELITMYVYYLNQPPIAHIADIGYEVHVGEPITLDGSGSYDPEGEPITYVWSIISRPAGSVCTIYDATSVMPTFVPDVEGAYTITLEVSDGQGSEIVSTIIHVIKKVPIYGDIAASVHLFKSNGDPEESSRGVLVKLKGRTNAGERIRESGLTNDYGTCIFDNVPDGRYVVIPYARGYRFSPSSEKIDHLQGTSVIVPFTGQARNKRVTPPSDGWIL